MDWQQTASVGSAVWLSVALIASVLAGMQGRGKLWWFFITLLFGPFALFFLAVWTKPLTRRD